VIEKGLLFVVITEGARRTIDWVSEYRVAGKARRRCRGIAGVDFLDLTARK
jgi:hypothetical protein